MRARLAFFVIAVMLAISPLPASAATPPFTILLENGTTLSVPRVEPWSQGYVRAIAADGSISFIPSQRIRSITDASGHDWTHKVLDSREAVGEAPRLPDVATSDRLPAAAVHSDPSSKEATVIAVRAEPWPQGFVKVVLLDGESMFIAEQRIVRIRDSAGGDLTNRVLGKRERVEEAGLEVRYKPANPFVPVLRGHPKPEKDWFPVIQAGTLFQLNRSDVVGEDSEGAVVLDLGAMKNVGTRGAIGGSVYFGFDPDRSRVGAKLRYRRWLTRSISIDAAPGFVIGGTTQNGNRYYAYPGFVGELGLSLADWVTVTGQVETRHVTQSQRNIAWSSSGYPNPALRPPEESTEVSWYLGAKFGGEFSLPGLLLSAIVFGALNTDMAQTFTRGF